MSASEQVTIENIKDAAERIQPFIHKTPILTSEHADTISGRSLYFKAECFQKTGSFKIRGACNAVMQLSEEESTLGVVTHSSGNHAAAVAKAAKMRGIPAHIIVPSDTPTIKKRAVETYGGNLILCEPTMDSREATCAEIQHQTGAAFIHPYQHPSVICGQGTIALELLQQTNLDLDAIIVPVSGGGMISGIATAAKALKPSIKIIAAEPCGRNNAADVAACVRSGALLSPPLPKPKTICDGLQGRLGPINWNIVSELVDGVIVVSEEEVVAAMQVCFERMKVVVEPSGAAGLAAACAMKGDTNYDGLKKVGVILCGGNVDLESKNPGFWSNWLLDG